MNELGLGERAMDAWAENEKDQECRDVGLFNRAREHFRETFGTEAEFVERTSYGVEIGADEMVFLINLMRKSYQLWGKCPNCGRHCWSFTFTDLVGLGRMLVEFGPTVHTCETSEPVVQTLRKVLREILAGAE